jgi:parallel beta-helix repeat protein
MKKACVTILFLLSLTIPMFVHTATSAEPITTIFIQPDGSISPSNVPIQRDGDVYTFTGDVHDPILIQKSNVTVDGAGYSVIGSLTEEERKSEQLLGTGPNATLPPYIIGLDCDKTVDGLTIKNLNVDNFEVGVYIRTTHNTLMGDAVSGNLVGILLSGSANMITKNYIFDNEMGLFFGFTQVNGSASNIPTDIDISDNSFINNTYELTGCVCKVYNFSEPIHSWDNGTIGNYWSNYNGTDADHDGIGDTYYRIDVLNQDRYPLIVSPAKPPVPVAQFPFETTAIGVAVALVAVTAVLVYWRYRKKNQG